MPSSSTFLITALGRSGTLFLSRTMNLSPTWTVEHEPNTQEPRFLSEMKDLSRFGNVNYGEVNSRLRWVADKVQVGKLGVIIRNPREHCVSLYNKNFRLGKGHANYNKVFKPGEHEAGLRVLDKLIQAGAITIRFERMTTELSYLEHLLWRFGISDAPLTESSPANKKNVNARRRAKTWDDIPENIQQLFHEQQAWFEEKYYAGTETQEVPNPV